MRAIYITAYAVIILLLTLCMVSPGYARQAANPASANNGQDSINLESLRQLMEQRLALMPDVARHKWNNQSPIEDLPREQKIIDSLKEQASALGVPGGWAERFFRAQIEAAKTIQREHFARWQAADQGKFSNVPDLDKVIRPELDRLTPLLLRQLAACWPALADSTQQVHIVLIMKHLHTTSPQAAAQAGAPLIDGSTAP
jgi:chorismate mutase-like protein